MQDHVLILTRKIDQGVRIYDASGRYVCRVIVYGVERDRARLAFKADDRFIILRDELVEPEESPK